jgi:hypothetical protein
MRFLLITLFILNSALSYSQQAEFKFKSKVHRFGKVIEGEKISTQFSFTNVGDAPLLINNYEVACTCTKVEFPAKPILPGESGEITINFDSKGKMGYQDRTIKLFSNAKDSPFELRITMVVKNN